ncbi:MAG: ABC transporter substrate-binding protein, partial [Streptosporangiaceae bacterium]
RLLFLRNWPSVYGEPTNPRHSMVAGKFGAAVRPGQDGPGVSVLGGANLAISAFSQHPATALAFIRFLTSLPSERRILVDAALPPVWTRLYGDPALIRRFPYLPVLRRAIMSAVLRPQTPIYDQLSLAISSSVHQALAAQVPVSKTLTSLNSELNRLVRTR